MNQKARTVLRSVVVSLGIVQGLTAETFHPISSIQSSTSATDHFPVERLIAGPKFGFEIDPPHDAIDGGEAATIWVTDACKKLPCDYFGSLPEPVLVLDLGKNRPLSEISVWGYSVTNTNGAKKARLRFATDSEGPGKFGKTIDFSPSFTLENDDTHRQSFPFGRMIVAQYVEVTLTDNFFRGDGKDGGDRVGLGEIAFATPSGDADEILVTAPNEFELKSGRRGSSALIDLLRNSDINFWSVEKSEENGIVYLSAPTKGQIYRVDLSVVPLAATVLVDSPGAVFHGLAINDEDDILYAADSATDTIKKYNPSTGAEIGSLGANFVRPNEVIYDPATDRVFVSDSGVDKIFIYTKAGVLDVEISDSTTEGVWGLAIDPESQSLVYSSHDLGKIYRRPAAAGTISATLVSGLRGPRGLGYDRRGQLYCVESGGNRVRTFGQSTNPIYRVARNGRDVYVGARCDIDGDFLPDEWEATEGGSALAFFGDDDQDEIINAIEAATGGSTSRSDDHNPVEMELDSNGEFVISHQALKKSSFEYTLWLSDDLITWKPSTIIPSRVIGAGIYDTWTYRFSPREAGFESKISSLFSRVGVEVVE